MQSTGELGAHDTMNTYSVLYGRGGRRMRIQQLLVVMKQKGYLPQLHRVVVVPPAYSNTILLYHTSLFALLAQQHFFHRPKISKCQNFKLGCERYNRVVVVLRV